ncbi:MAG: YD repeat-containing protein, partial [Magnetococcus sp. DMHC-1]
MAIVAPDGQRTKLTVDANGFLTSVTNPASETYAMQYTDGGLLTSFRNPRNFTTTMTYNDLGRMVRESNPVGGLWELDKVSSTTGYTASITSALGRKSRYFSESLLNGDKRLFNTDPDGRWSETLSTPGKSRTVNHTDGTIIVEEDAPDPRFGMVAPYLKSRVTRTPGGLINTAVLVQRESDKRPSRISYFSFPIRHLN